mgnify:CR=1 FL=1
MSVGRIMPMGRLKTKELPPTERIKGFIPYVEDYTLFQAVYEASRCFWCHDPPCVKSCPAGINIPEFIFALASRDLRTAAKIVRERNVFGGVCGYVCPVEKLCEEACVRKDFDEPVAIGMLQRFIYLYEKERGARLLGAAARNAIYVHEGNVLGIPLEGMDHIPAVREAREKGVSTGLTYIEGIAALAASKIEEAAKTGRNRMDIRVRIARRPSDVNIKTVSYTHLTLPTN